MGDPAGEIVRIAAEEGVDMIVLGTHGRSGISRMLMGSVAEGVVRRASCPVLVSRAAAETLVGRKAEALHL
jgi:nucleotide-binding universal stress UspA family protein